MKWFILFLLLFLALLLESTITSLPLVLIILFCAAVVWRNSAIFLWGFVTGLVLDSLLLQPLGKSSIFFIIFLTAAFLYERKFEVQSIPFVGIFSFVGSFIYLWIYGYKGIIWEAMVSASITILLFLWWFGIAKRFA